MTRTAEEEVEESVFQQAYIPRNLEEVDDYERDHQRLADGGARVEGIYYQAMNGMLAESAVPVEKVISIELEAASVSEKPSLPEEEQMGAASQQSSAAEIGTAEEGPDRVSGTEARRYVFSISIGRLDSYTVSKHMMLPPFTLL